MKRSLLLVVAVAAMTTPTGCGNTPQPQTAAAPTTAKSAQTTTAVPVTVAPVGAQAPGVPALSGTPTDLSAPVQAQAGSGAPQPGLVLQDVVVGTGQAATMDDTVDVRYTGTVYATGTLFDSSWSDGSQPISFGLRDVVPGFAQGIEGMQIGGRRVIVIPPDLGYGDASPTAAIPPGATLVFVVDLVGVG